MKIGIDMPRRLNTQQFIKNMINKIYNEYN